MRKLILGILGLGLCFTGIAQEIATQKKDAFEGVKSIKVDGDFCAVNITGSKNSKVSFEGEIKAEENKDQYKLETSLTDGVLSIKVETPAQWRSHWGEINLSIPKSLNVEINTQSGKVEAVDLEGINLNVVSKSGHVVLRNFEGAVYSDSPAGDLKVDGMKGALKGKTKSGSVIISNVAGDCDITNNKGESIINNIKGNLTVWGGAGTQEIENVEGNVKLKSTSGDTKLSLAKGNISCRLFDGAIKLFNTEGVHEIETSTGTITGTRVHFTGSSSITSTEGNVKIQMSSKENLAFVLKSDNSYLRAMGKSKKKSLKIGKGDIVITGTSTSGSQAYY